MTTTASPSTNQAREDDQAETDFAQMLPRFFFVFLDSFRVHKKNQKQDWKWPLGWQIPWRKVSPNIRYASILYDDILFNILKRIHLWYVRFCYVSLKRFCFISSRIFACVQWDTKSWVWSLQSSSSDEVIFPTAFYCQQRIMHAWHRGSSCQDVCSRSA